MTALVYYFISQLFETCRTCKLQSNLSIKDSSLGPEDAKIYTIRARHLGLSLWCPY